MTDSTPNSFDRADEPARSAQACVTEDFQALDSVIDREESNFDPHRTLVGSAPEAPEPVVAEDPACAIESEVDEDVSIEEYMSQLLARVGSGGADAPAVPPPVPAAPQPVIKDAEAESAENEEEPEPEAASRVEVRLTKRPPENRAGLASMRELANAQAQDALRTHSCRRLSRRIMGYLAFILTTLATSCVLAYVSSSSSSNTYFVSVVLFVLAVMGTWRYSSMAHNLSTAAVTELANQAKPELPAAD